MIVGTSEGDVLLDDVQIVLESAGGSKYLLAATAEGGVAMKGAEDGLVVADGEYLLLETEAGGAEFSAAGPGGGVVAAMGLEPEPNETFFGLEAVEAYEYAPYGAPTVHSREAGGAAALRTITEAKTVAVSGDYITANVREGDARGAWLSAMDSPIGQSTPTSHASDSAAASSFGLKYLYTGRVWNPAGEVYWYRARWYSPAQGRFLSRDPIGYMGGANQYLYCYGNPVRWRDPSGLVPDGEEPGYLLRIFVDQPGSGGDRDPYEGLFRVDVGHAFLDIIGPDGKQTGPSGFYPGDDVGPDSPRTRGMVQEDSNHGWDTGRSFFITEQQASKVKSFLSSSIKTPPTYDLNDYNCAEFVIEAAAQGGITIPYTTGDWYRGGGRNPGDLGEDLKAMPIGTPIVVPPPALPTPPVSPPKLKMVRPPLDRRIR